MKEDIELLKQYVAHRSESAFAELVSRHCDLVYSAALRQVNGDTGLAQDIVQSVFIDLARKASGLLGHSSLSGWLYTSVRFAAANARRADLRRQQREWEAHTMKQLLADGSGADSTWETLKPLLDEAMYELRDQDRHAIILRFFERKTLAEVGRAIGLDENAARKRVERSVEKLRASFLRRGATVSAAALIAAISANAVSTTPPGLAATVAASTLAAVSHSYAVPMVQIIKLMTLSKMKIAIGMLTIGMATTIVFQAKTAHRLREENQALLAQSAQVDELRAEIDRLSKAKSNDRAKLTEDQMNELLRLRGEVGVLRNRVAAAPKREAPAKRVQESTDLTAEQQQEQQIAKMNFAKQLVMASVIYAGKNAENYPPDMGSAASLINAENKEMTNRFELLYHGPINALTNPANTIIFRETEAVFVNGKWQKTYGFADGHSEIHSFPDQDFDQWEKERIIEPNQQ